MSSKKFQNRAARFVTGNYNFETGSMTGILEHLKWESLNKRRRDSRLILLYKRLKDKASIPTDDLIPLVRRCRNDHSIAYQVPIANTDIYKCSSPPPLQTISDWNALPDSFISSAEGADDGVAKFTSLVRARDVSLVLVLVNDCHSDVSPVTILILSKLFSYGIGGKTLKWIDSFLCIRQQRVVLNGIKSDWPPVLSGVPHGTVLGPLLFSLYINDITSDIESEIRLLSDDCVCYREIKVEEDIVKLQRDIDRLGCWARTWGMKYQPVKCNMMQPTRKRIKKSHASYTLEGTDLENVASIKYLGVTITNELRWNTHVSNVCTKANRALGFLRRNLHSCPEEVKEAA